MIKIFCADGREVLVDAKKNDHVSLLSDGVLRVIQDSRVVIYSVEASEADDQTVIEMQPHFSNVEWMPLAMTRLSGGHGSHTRSTGSKISKVKAQMPGKIVKSFITAGQKITKGTPLLVLEAMKMENELKAPISGTIDQCDFEVGQAVESGQLLITIRPEE